MEAKDSPPSLGRRLLLRFERLFGGPAPSRRIESSFEDVQSMLQQAARMFDLAVASLLENEPLAVDLDHLDDVVDDGERTVRRSVLEHLSVQPRHELEASLVLLTMVQDAERIGDFARGLAELVPLARSPRQGPFAERLLLISRRLRPRFEATVEAFTTHDVSVAKKAIADYRDDKRDLIALTRDIADSNLPADMAVVYSGAARVLRRIGAHLSNICSAVSQPYDRIRHGDEDA